MRGIKTTSAPPFIFFAILIIINLLPTKDMQEENKLLSKLVITFICENRHDVETVAFDLSWEKDVSEEEIWKWLTKDCRCKKCGSKKFLYRTRYKE